MTHIVQQSGITKKRRKEDRPRFLLKGKNWACQMGLPGKRESNMSVDEKRAKTREERCSVRVWKRKKR